MNMFWKRKYGYKWNARCLHTSVQKTLEHVCSNVFKTILNVHVLVSNHEEERVCPEWKNSFQTRSQFKKHVNVNH